MFGVPEIIGITSIGVGSFAATQFLQHMERPDLAKTLDISVGISAILYVVYKVVDGIKIVSTMFFL